jgi:hypothetical protein
MNICAICVYVNISLTNNYKVKTICTISDNGIDDWLIDWLIDCLLVFSQPQYIKFTSCLPMIGGSLRVLRLLPSLKQIAMV